MHAVQRTLAAAMGFWVLAACSSPSQDRYTSAPPASLAASESGTSIDAIAGTGEVPTYYQNVDRYKETLARHILQHNADYSFSGPLPMILPSVVVLRMSVDSAGRLTDLDVQRSRNARASQLALAAMRRSIALPQPHNLIGPREHALTFSETFLFNDDFRFQLRSLAEPQPLLEE